MKEVLPRAWTSPNLIIETYEDLRTIGLVVRMSILDTKVGGSIPSINMFSP